MLPILYQNKDLILYSYPLLMGIGWGVAYQIFFSLLDPHISRLKGQILFWGIFLSAWIGAKVFFLLTMPDHLNDRPLIEELSFWTGGGFVFYGGFLTGLLFIGIFKSINRSLGVKDLWPMIPALAIGHGIGRIGCFLAGCCYGKPTDFFWGIYLHNHYRHPTQLIEAFALIALGLYLLKSNLSHSLKISRYLLIYGILRLVIEALRGDTVRGQWGLLTPSQWISLFLILVGISLARKAKSAT